MPVVRAARLGTPCPNAALKPDTWHCAHSVAHVEREPVAAAYPEFHTGPESLALAHLVRSSRVTAAISAYHANTAM